VGYEKHHPCLGPRRYGEADGRLAPWEVGLGRSSAPAHQDSTSSNHLTESAWASVALAPGPTLPAPAPWRRHSLGELAPLGQASFTNHHRKKVFCQLLSRISRRIIASHPEEGFNRAVVAVLFSRLCSLITLDFADEVSWRLYSTYSKIQMPNQPMGISPGFRQMNRG
jgi:hypothetical protein